MQQRAVPVKGTAGLVVCLWVRGRADQTVPPRRLAETLSRNRPARRQALAGLRRTTRIARTAWQTLSRHAPSSRPSRIGLMLRDLERPVAQADAADPNEEGVLSRRHPAAAAARSNQAVDWRHGCPATGGIGCPGSTSPGSDCLERPEDGRMIRRIDRGVDAQFGSVGPAAIPASAGPPTADMGRCSGRPLPADGSGAADAPGSRDRRAGSDRAYSSSPMSDHSTAGTARKMAGAARRARKPLVGIIRVEALIRAAPSSTPKPGSTGRPQRSRPGRCVKTTYSSALSSPLFASFPGWRKLSHGV